MFSKYLSQRIPLMHINGKNSKMVNSERINNNYMNQLCSRYMIST